MSNTLLISASATERLGRSREWLSQFLGGSRVLVLGASNEAARSLAYQSTLTDGARFGLEWMTLFQAAVQLAAPELVKQGRSIASFLIHRTLVSRGLFSLSKESGLGAFEGISQTPGFGPAVAETIEALRLEQVDVKRLDGRLSGILESYERQLDEYRAADRAEVYRLAAAAAAAGSHPCVGRPLLLIDVPVQTLSERALVAALADRSTSCLATAVEGDDRTIGHLEKALGCTARRQVRKGPEALVNLQAHLFTGVTPEQRDEDETVFLMSAAGEGQECVEIARRICGLARVGVPFDRIGVMLRSPRDYGPHLEEALARADVPAFYTGGTERPDPGGRAFLSLLRCAADGLSATRFSEYLSFGQVPQPDSDGQPPAAWPAGDRWVDVEGDEARRNPGSDADAPHETEVERSTMDRAVRSPRRWERLIVDAAVIGGVERWERRLKGLELELEQELSDRDDPTGTADRRVERDLKDLRELGSFALPLLRDLDVLSDCLSWGDWLDSLSRLATRSLRRPQPVLAALQELEPLRSVQPVDLSDVIRILEQRLGDLRHPAEGSRFGKVYVAGPDRMRGLCFDTVFIPGLTERVFPQRITEDPILPDDARALLNSGLPEREQRISAERLALRIGVGAANRQVVLSFPRVDPVLSKQRVPSFYGFEALRAAEGQLPSVDAYLQRAERAVPVQPDWPAPTFPGEAIDDPEYDLAVLRRLFSEPTERAQGQARYLIGSSPHLARSLRARWEKGSSRWTGNDGFVAEDGGAHVLEAYYLSERSCSPTALQNYAACPYRYFLYAVMRLKPREEAAAIEDLNPLQRGELIHELHFQTLETLRSRELLPVTGDTIGVAFQALDEVVARVSAEYEDRLAPAVEQVWKDSVASIRRDLRQWLDEMRKEGAGFVPWRFEQTFGMKRGPHGDAGLAPEGVALDSGLLLKGVIDLIEKHPDNVIRITDFKTGRASAPRNAIVDKGEMLQPVLYSLAAEKLFPELSVSGGRLQFSTARGGFEEHKVRLDERARRAESLITQTIGEALQTGFLPAAPREEACRYCDYKPVCGHHEERRTRRKPADDRFLKIRREP